MPVNTRASRPLHVAAGCYYAGSLRRGVRQRSPACGPGGESSADCIGSARLSSARCACQRGWFHITVDGAGGQCRDNLMKTKRALSVKPLVATAGAQLKQNQMDYFEHVFFSCFHTDTFLAGEKNKTGHQRGLLEFILPPRTPN